MRIAVDALNLARDRRGMGRVVRNVLAAARARSDLAITLLGTDERTARELGFEAAPRALGARRGRFDAAWLPWNGWRFTIRAPSLVTMYDAFAFDEPARGIIARRREQEPIRRAARRATRITTISNYSRERIAVHLHLDPAAIAVVPLAPDSLFCPGDEPSPIDRPYVLFVAGAEARKNAPFFLSAFADAIPAREVALVVAGRLEPAAEAFLSRGTISTIRVAPDDRTLRALYRNAIAVAVPSRAEGYGLVAAEALACGAPVIAAEAAALPEVTAGAALLVGPDDRTGWISALRAVASDDALRAGLSAKGAARYGFARRDHAAQMTLDLLSALVQQPDPVDGRA